MKYNLQIAGQTVKIEKAFRGVFGGAPSEFTVKGYEAFETRSTGKPRVGFTQSIIGSVTGSITHMNRWYRCGERITYKYN